ncbi:MAG: prepilin peptidase [Hyphomonadaceae bacterium]|nr:prepilin peptidase [Hyphomonadaceae bacterium]
MLETAFTFAFVGLVLVAAASDIARMTIPNWVSAALIALYPIAALVCGASWATIGGHFLVGAIALTVCFGLFSVNALGGGDAKLIPAVALWTGAAAFLPFIAGMAIAGGALSLTLLLARRAFAPADGRPDFVNRLLNKKRGAPYGVAIAVGAICAAPHLMLAP